MTAHTVYYTKLKDTLKANVKFMYLQGFFPDQYSSNNAEVTKIVKK